MPVARRKMVENVVFFAVVIENLAYHLVSSVILCRKLASKKFVGASGKQAQRCYRFG